jgi:hypothetical protein
VTLDLRAMAALVDRATGLLLKRWPDFKTRPPRWSHRLGVLADLRGALESSALAWDAAELLPGEAPEEPVEPGSEGP